jgi:protein-S-isoprenylcysteine O-methyltransferase Ste14
MGTDADIHWTPVPAPLVYTWPYALIFWAVFFWAFAPEFRVVVPRDGASPSAQDAGSKRLILAGQGVAALSAFWIAAAVRSASLPQRVWLFWLGLAVVAGGSLLRRHCRRMLGASFTGAVVVRPDQEVVERGIYHYVRHPSYTAGTLLYLGMGLALANWISLLVLLAVNVVVYGYRVAVEERALEQTLGEPYRRYMRRTKRFVPFLF